MLLRARLALAALRRCRPASPAPSAAAPERRRPRSLSASARRCAHTAGGCAGSGPAAAPRVGGRGVGLRLLATSPQRAATAVPDSLDQLLPPLADDDDGDDADDADAGGAAGVPSSPLPAYPALANADQPLEPGALYVVSTPIGNLEDVTLRALRVLRLADVIFAEDTRTTGQLLRCYGLLSPRRPRRLLSLHAHNEAGRVPGAVAALAAGASLALVSDAGTPGLSDPGQRLVAAAAAAGAKVVPVPGASALLSALAASGLPAAPLLFAGFLPPDPPARRRRLRELAPAVLSDGGIGGGVGAFGAIGGLSASLCLYVPPHKAAATLADAAAALGAARRCVVARELTKAHEELWRGSLGDAAAEFARPGRARGEFTLLVEGGGCGGGDVAAGGEGGDVAGAAAGAAAGADVASRLAALLAAGESPSRAARAVAAATGRGRRGVYAAAVSAAAAAAAAEAAAGAAGAAGAGGGDGGAGAG